MGSRPPDGSARVTSSGGRCEDTVGSVSNGIPLTRVVVFGALLARRSTGRTAEFPTVVLGGRADATGSDSSKPVRARVCCARAAYALAHRRRMPRCIPFFAGGQDLPGIAAFRP